ncbi:MAG: hypothetical protein ABSD71_07435 [Bacteroidales bacterium]|jgi:hypothetical protein
MKFDGNYWKPVENEGFTKTITKEPIIAFNSSCQPYVVFVDGNSGKATVMKYDSVFVVINDQPVKRYILVLLPTFFLRKRMNGGLTHGK